jgi:hypothetical protein
MEYVYVCIGKNNKYKQMKKTILATLVILAFVAVPSQSFAQVSSSQTVNAAAKIIAPIQLSLTSGSMDFGTITKSTNGGTVVLSSAGTATGNGVTLLTTSTSTAVAVPTFTVTGEVGNTFNIVLPTTSATNPVVLTSGTGTGAPTMDVTYFTTSLANNSGTLTSESQTFKVGATLNVGSGQASGSYTGSFSVTVNYN